MIPMKTIPKQNKNIQKHQRPQNKQTLHLLNKPNTNNKYQILAFLEKTNKNNTNKTIYTLWNELWILTNTNYTPIQDLQVSSGLTNPNLTTKPNINLNKPKQFHSPLQKQRPLHMELNLFNWKKLKEPTKILIFPPKTCPNWFIPVPWNPTFKTTLILCSQSMRWATHDQIPQTNLMQPELGQYSKVWFY